MSTRQVLLVFLWIAVVMFLPQTAMAYLDPGTGGYVIQVVVGAALGIAFTVKTYWGLLKTKITGLFSRQ